MTEYNLLFSTQSAFHERIFGLLQCLCEECNSIVIARMCMQHIRQIFHILAFNGIISYDQNNDFYRGSW